MTYSITSKEYIINTKPVITNVTFEATSDDYTNIRDKVVKFTSTIKAYTSPSSFVAITIPNGNDSQTTTYSGATFPDKNIANISCYTCATTNGSQYKYIAGQSITQISEYTSNSTLNIHYGIVYNDGIEDSDICYAAASVPLPPISLPSQENISTLLANGTYTTAYSDGNYPFFYNQFKMELPDYQTKYITSLALDSSGSSKLNYNIVKNGVKYELSNMTTDTFAANSIQTLYLTLSRGKQSYTTALSLHRIPSIESITLNNEQGGWKFSTTTTDDIRFYDSDRVRGILNVPIAALPSTYPAQQYTYTLLNSTATASLTNIPITYDTINQKGTLEYVYPSGDFRAFEQLLPDTVISNVSAVTRAQNSGLVLRVDNPFYIQTLPFTTLPTNENAWNFNATPVFTGMIFQRGNSNGPCETYSTDIFENDQFILTGNITSPRVDPNSRFSIVIGGKVVMEQDLTLSRSTDSSAIYNRYYHNFNQVITASPNVTGDTIGNVQFKYLDGTSQSSVWRYRRLDYPIISQADVTYTSSAIKISTTVPSISSYDTDVNIAHKYSAKYTEYKDNETNYVLYTSDDSIVYCTWPSGMPNTLYVRPITYVNPSRPNEGLIPKKDNILLEKLVKARVIVVYRAVPNLHWGQNAIAINDDKVNDTSIVEFNAYDAHKQVKFINGSTTALITLEADGIQLNGFVLDGGDWVNENPSIVGFIGVAIDQQHQAEYNALLDASHNQTSTIYGLPWRSE